jgi:hypothetical protein
VSLKQRIQALERVIRPVETDTRPAMPLEVQAAFEKAINQWLATLPPDVAADQLELHEIGKEVSKQAEPFAKDRPPEEAIREAFRRIGERKNEVRRIFRERHGREPLER